MTIENINEPPEGYHILGYKTQKLGEAPSDCIFYEWVHDDSGRCKDGFSSYIEAVESAHNDSGEI